MIPSRFPLAAVCVLATAPALPAQQQARQLTSPAAPETRAEIVLPELGLTVVDRRAVLPDGTIVRTTTDAQGAPVDLDALRELDAALGHERRGKLSPELYERVAGMAPADVVEVALWLVEPVDGFDSGHAIDELVRGLPEAQVSDAVHALRPSMLEINAARFRPAVEAVADAARGAGGEVLVEGLGWPLVVARVPVAELPALAASDLVDEVYYSHPTWFEEGEYPLGTMRTYNVHDAGFTADGSVRVMVNDTAQVDLEHDYLPPVIALNTDGVGSHATSVAGNIANTHPDYYASSYTLPEIYTAGGSGDSIAPVNWNLGLGAGIDFGNCSWWNGSKGSIVFLDRFFDYTIRKYSVMLFKSNGNQGTSGTPYSTTPGNGYNMICTGNYDDDSDALWGGDAMVASSSYWNPSQGHEKPEVASPGNCVTTTSPGTTALNTCFGGTSSASPLTAGVATLMASYDNTLLSEMTSVKALLMASAWHNVEGDPLLSDRDGAGGVHGTAAHTAVRDGQWWYDLVEDGDFVGDELEITMPLLAGDQTRVCALWFSTADSGYFTDVLNMDLDMVVLDPSGTPVASSASALNPFEIASFIPAVSGDYTVRLTKMRFDGFREQLSVAWSTRSDAAVAQVLFPGPTPFAVGETPEIVLRERYEGSGKVYALFAAGGGPVGIPAGNGFTWPTAVDGLVSLTASLPGFIGFLDGNGEATASFPVPDDPTLANLVLHFGAFVFDYSPVDGFDLREVSPDTPITILP